MSREKIEDVIRKVILGESFDQEVVEEVNDEVEGDEDLEGDVAEDLEEEIEELEEVASAVDDGDQEDAAEEEDKKEKKLPAFLKKFMGKKKGKDSKEDKAEDKKETKKEKNMKNEAAEAINDKQMTANGKTVLIAEPTGASVEKNRATIKAKKSDAKATTEEVQGIETLLAGQNLSEEFVTKATTLFEAHVSSRVSAITEELQADYEALLEEHTESVTEELVERIDQYLNYVVEEWMQENRLAVDSGLRTEVTEQFIGNLRELFAESYIEVPEERLDLLEEAVESCSSLETELDEQIQDTLHLAEQNEQLHCEILLRDISEGLTDTDSEKLRALAEDIEFETVEQFAEKLTTIKENIGSIGNKPIQPKTSSDIVEESFNDDSEVPASPLMEAYMRSMSKNSL
jgi:hypothetical protein